MKRKIITIFGNNKEELYKEYLKRSNNGEIVFIQSFISNDSSNIIRKDNINKTRSRNIAKMLLSDEVIFVDGFDILSNETRYYDLFFKSMQIHLKNKIIKDKKLENIKIYNNRSEYSMYKDSFIYDILNESIDLIYNSNKRKEFFNNIILVETSKNNLLLLDKLEQSENRLTLLSPYFHIINNKDFLIDDIMKLSKDYIIIKDDINFIHRFKLILRAHRHNIQNIYIMTKKYIKGVFKNDKSDED